MMRLKQKINLNENSISKILTNSKTIYDGPVILINRIFLKVCTEVYESFNLFF